MTIELAHCTAPTDHARILVSELDAELSGAYSAEQAHGFSIDRIFQPQMTFFLAYLDGQPVGCGGVWIENDFGEIKRMYVRPAARGSGAAAAIMAKLEETARSRGVPRLTLETGDIRHAAMKFYERSGFRRCGPFGEYARMPTSAIERSVFFEKPL